MLSCIISITSLLFLIILIVFAIKMLFGCLLIAENLPICTTTTEDQWAYKPKHQGLNHQAPKCPLPLWQQLQQAHHRDRSRGCTRVIQHAFRLELIVQYINSWGHGSALFLSDVISNSEFDTNLRYT